jgi:polyhydroxyalkanoate synthase
MKPISPAGRAAATLARGMQWLLEAHRPEVDCTPRSAVLQEGKLTVYRFEGGDRRHGVPVLLIPPLMVKPYIFDLRPGHSMAAYFMERGFDTYLVDFGIPDSGDQHIRIDDYALDFLPRAVDCVLRVAAQPRVTLCGYCMGGLFSLLYAAAPGQGKVRNLVAIACPVDFGKMGLISYATGKAHAQISAVLDRMGNIPSYLPAVAMRLSNPMTAITRYSDLFMNIWNDEYLKGYESLSAWMNDFIPGPHDAFQEYFEKFVVGNALMNGRVDVAGQTLDLRDVDCSMLALAGRTDNIATVDSTQEIVNLVGGSDKTFEVVSGGHVGVMAGSRAPLNTWKTIENWLRSRSET